MTAAFDLKEPARRRLDKGLPKLDMYRQQTRKLPSDAPASPLAALCKLQAETRKLYAEARADREAAALALAEARLHAATIVAEAQVKVAAKVDAGPALPSVAEIQTATAERHGITLSALLGKGMARHIVAARYEAIRLAHAARPDLSSPSLGRLFRRDHTTVLRAIKMGEPS